MDIRCRTCLKINNKFSSLFIRIKNNILISDMIMACTSILVEKDDGLPKYICNNCLETLNSAYDFKVMVIEANKELHNMYYKNGKSNDSQKHGECNDNLIIEEEVQFGKDEILNQDSKIILTRSKHKPCFASNGLTDKHTIKNNWSLDGDDKNNIPAEICNSSVVNSNNYCGNEVIMELIEKDTHLEQEALFLYQNIIGNNEHQSKQSTNEEENMEILFEENSLTESSDYSDSDSSIEVQKPIQIKSENNSLNDDKHHSILPNSLDISLEYQKAKVGLSKTEKNKKIVFCKECNRSFGFRYYFEIHVRHHTGDKPFICEVCGKGFAKQFILNNHKIIHTDSKSFSCDQCGKSYRFLSGLINHKSIHSDERPHKCDVCSKTFKQANNLKIHLLRHKDERKCTCEICGKCFVDKSGLSAHMACHTDEKKFPCPECGKSFASKGRMKDHFKQHLDEKRYACNYCDKRFNRNTILQKHILIHTGAKPYSCKICGKAFRQSASVSNHMRIHTGETRFACEVCPVKFKYKHHLSNHMKVHK